ncbi:MAG: hypothetical protein EBZ36_15865 [Acidobacteria bacterium]|nr:hypothetical protein [Acidobacteriota bacterium]
MTRISTDSLGQQSTGGDNYSGRFSPDGDFVILTSDATSLVPGDTNGQRDLFLKNLQTGEITRISTDASGQQAVGGLTLAPRLSEDGRYATFTSRATNLVPGDTNGYDDIFVKDLQTGAISRISTDASGAQSTGGDSYASFFSFDGRFVAFESDAANLVPGDTNGRFDAFVKDLSSGRTYRVFQADGGVQSDGDTFSIRISPDGRFLTSASLATNLVPGDTNSAQDVFIQTFSTVSTGIIPGLAGYMAGNAGLLASDDTEFRIDGNLIGVVDITATMTVSDYLEAVSTSTGGRVSAQYDVSSGEFIYQTAVISEGKGVLSITTSGTSRSWLGHGLSGGNQTVLQSAFITLTDRDWTVGGSGALSNVSSGSGQLLTASGARLADEALDVALVSLNAEMAILSANARAIEVQDKFNTFFSATMERGLSNLVDADLALESARLQSLQIRRQLGSQAFSIANQAPQMILSLFRG